jgi:hypothetical protein
MTPVSTSASHIPRPPRGPCRSARRPTRPRAGAGPPPTAASPHSPAARRPAPPRRVPATAPPVPPSVRRLRATHTSTTTHAFRYSHFCRLWLRPALCAPTRGLTQVPRSAVYWKWKGVGTLLSTYRPLWTHNLLAKRQRAAYGGTVSPGGSPVGGELLRRQDCLEPQLGAGATLCWIVRFGLRSVGSMRTHSKTLRLSLRGSFAAVTLSYLTRGCPRLQARSSQFSAWTSSAGNRVEVQSPATHTFPRCYICAVTKCLGLQYLRGQDEVMQQWSNHDPLYRSNTTIRRSLSWGVEELRIEPYSFEVVFYAR